MPDKRPHHWVVRAPETTLDWETYYELRWRILRAPWHQGRGSERDALDDSGIHRMVCGPNNTVLAVGRLHRLDCEKAQIRYMAVEQAKRRQGLGTTILMSLEQAARELGVRSILLHARESAVPFYAAHGYRTIEPSHLLFKTIRHFLMQKDGIS